MRLIVRVVLALAGLLLSAQVARGIARRIAPGVAARLDQAPPVAVFGAERLLPRVPIEPGMRVLVLGPVADTLLRRVSQAVGKYGKLYVLEASPERVRRLNAQLAAMRIANAEVLTGQANRLDLPDATFDLVLAVGQLASLPARQRALWEFERVLRPGGHLSVSQALAGRNFLRSGTLRREADAVGLAWREQHGLPLAYTANFRKAG